jgi:acetamidase/formamidase
MALFEIEPERRTLHGTFSREFEPVLIIDPGDAVRFRTLDAGWNIDPRHSDDPGGKPRKFEPRDPEQDGGHALCGPIAIRGARPGMTLEVRINEIQMGSWGFTPAGGWDSEVYRRLGVVDLPGVVHLWTLDGESMTGRNQHGHVIALRPFMGVMGMPPDEPGLHSTSPPRLWGGNMDCKELVAGSTLYLPIPVEGALFSVGDGHAAQGDGEVCMTAIECPMDRVELTFRLRDDLPLTTPRAHTPAGWLTLGFHEDLNEGAFLAVETMLELMGEQFSLERADALALASLVVDLRITQIVNGVKGVHAVLPHGAVQGVK